MARNPARSELVELMDRHAGRCFYCGCRVAKPKGGCQPSSYWHATADHLHPRSLGGKTAGLRNVVLACFGCNQLKANMTLAVFLVLAHAHAREA